MQDRGLKVLLTKLALRSFLWVLALGGPALGGESQCRDVFRVAVEAQGTAFASAHLSSEAVYYRPSAEMFNEFLGGLDSQRAFSPSGAKSEIAKSIILLVKRFVSSHEFIIEETGGVNNPIVSVVLQAPSITASGQSPYFPIEVYFKPRSWPSIPIKMAFLTNGRALFLQSSHTLRRARFPHTINVPRQFVYLDSNSDVLLGDQGSVFLNSLPSVIQLTRSMSAAERSMWLDGGDPAPTIYGPRLHFGYNHFRFMKEPYYFLFHKEKIVEMYQRGLIEINTYETVSDYGGMDEASFTPFGLPFELVVLGTEGINEIRGTVREGLKQGLLDLYIPGFMERGFSL